MRAPARNRSISVNSPTIPPRCSVMTLEAIRYRSGSLQILNQLLLPHQTVYDEIRSVQDAYEAIKSMKVRSSFLFSPPPPPSLSQLSLPLPSRCACPLQCASIPAVHVFCRRSFVLQRSNACVAICSPPCSRCRPLFLFWMHLQHPPATHKSPIIYNPHHLQKKSLPLCVSFHIIMCKARQTRYVHTATHP